MAAATTTAEQVCNLALQRIGCTDTIDDLEENTLEARACKVSYAAARDALLEMFDWRFARRRTALAQVVDAAGDAVAFSGWVYGYVLPADCIKPRGLYPLESKQPFTLELADDASGNPTVQALLTNVEEAELFYTAQITTVALWSPLFVQALSWLIAIDLCSALPKKLEWAPQVKAGFAAAFATAGSRNHGAEQESRPPESEFITGRE